MSTATRAEYKVVGVRARHMAGGDAGAAAKGIEHGLAEDIDGQQG
jgi:hypothetical protein